MDEEAAKSNLIDLDGQITNKELETEISCAADYAAKLVLCFMYITLIIYFTRLLHILFKFAFN